MTAIWTAPRTWTTSELVTKAIMDTHVRDNLDFLKTPASSGIITSVSNFTTTSTTFTDVTWATTTFTNYGGGFLVIFFTQIGVTTSAAVHIDLLVDGSSEGGSDGIVSFQTGGADVRTLAIPWKVSAKTAGSHTIKMRAKTSGGTLTIYGTTSNVKPFFYVVEFGA